MNNTPFWWVKGHKLWPPDYRPILVDRIYHDTYASLGLGVLNRAPVAFLPYEDRPHHFDLTKHIPQAIPLNQVGRALFQRDNNLLG